MSGALIAFEGVDGAGKTTQLAAFVARLRSLGLPVRSCAEPGGTPVGDDIRALLLRPGASIGPRTEALLFMASRAALMDAVVLPALARGEHVVMDRFFLSTYAYQAGGRGVPLQDLASANLFATHRVVPDLTVLLTLAEDHSRARRVRRGTSDRIEAEGHAFHMLVDQAFREYATRAWQHAHPEVGPVLAIPAEAAPEVVARRVWDSVMRVEGMTERLGVPRGLPACDSSPVAARQRSR